MNPLLAPLVGLGLGQPPDARVVGDDEAFRLVDAADDGRVLGLLIAACDAGLMDIGAEPLAALRSRGVDALRRCLAVESVVVRAVEALDSRGVRSRMLKGVPAAHLDEPDPSWRHFADADLLIPRDRYDDAGSALAGAGFVRRGAAVHPWWERRFGKAVEWVAPDGVELDLHLSPIGGGLGAALPLDRLWAIPPVEFMLAGCRVHALAAHARLLVAALHVACADPPPVRLVRDVAVLASDEPCWQQARATGTEWGIAAALAIALRAVGVTGALPPEHPGVRWAGGVAVTADDTARIAPHHRALGTAWGPEGRAQMAELPRMDRALFAAGVLWPSRASLRARGRTRIGHVKRLLREATRR